MKVVMSISETVTVLDYGEKIAEGTPAEIQQNPQCHRSLSGPRVVCRRLAGQLRPGGVEHADP